MPTRALLPWTSTHSWSFVYRRLSGIFDAPAMRSPARERGARLKAFLGGARLGRLRMERRGLRGGRDRGRNRDRDRASERGRGGGGGGEGDGEWGARRGWGPGPGAGPGDRDRDPEWERGRGWWRSDV